jgi:3-phenylpropionate/cinnamic acid dioxygenase small subunit
VRQFLHREARFLDDKRWESWLALYAPDVEFLDAGLGRRRPARHRSAATDHSEKSNSEE